MAEIVAAKQSAESAASHKLGVREKVAYGLGNFGIQMIFIPGIEFVVYFYTDVVGIAPATVGTLIFVSQFLWLFNPVMGVMVDRTHTRFGKARPWLLWMAAPFGISAALLFRSPDLGPAGKVIYAFVTFTLAFTVCYTLVDVPYSTLFSFMTTDRHERTSLSVIRMFFAYTGILLTIGLTLPAVKFFGGGAQGWGRTFMIFGAIATISLLACFAGTKERFQGQAANAKTVVPLKASVPALFRNKYLALLACVIFATFVALGWRIANLYYCRYLLHDAGLYGPLMVMMFAAQMFTLLFTPALARRFGKRNAALGGLLVTIAGQLLLYITPLTFTVLAIGTVIKGLGAGPIVGASFAMIADALEYGDWKWNLRNEGLAFGAMTLVMKTAEGFASATVGWVLGWGGYIAGAAVQSASALRSINILMLHLPLAFFVISALLLLAYNLDPRYPQIEAELRERRLASSAG
ncbi:MAG TPA: glycoside-pentoside-hexuronide (GPH):cation symporter [Patescibacteria group bacterium]|nr:glycoside-pentoside-hexuronide (GPH):cation symporter [Patescibacteria group bacterium]